MEGLKHIEVGKPESIGSIYLLTNRAFGDLIKIGYTMRSPQKRAKELSSATGVPYEFEVAYSVETINPEKIEKYIHNLLSDKRVKQGDSKEKEFFKIPLKEGINIVNLVVTPPIPHDPPDPPPITEQQKEERNRVVNELLQYKFKYRKDVIIRWIKRLEYMSKSNTAYENSEYGNAIEKTDYFNELYTYEVFLEEHKEVEGIEQVISLCPSPTLEETIGLVQNPTAFFIPRDKSWEASDGKLYRLFSDWFDFLPTKKFLFQKWSDFHDKNVDEILAIFSSYQKRYKNNKSDLLKNLVLEHPDLDPSYYMFPSISEINVRIGAFINWNPTAFDLCKKLSEIYSDDYFIDKDYIFRMIDINDLAPNFPIEIVHYNSLFKFKYFYLFSDKEYNNWSKQNWYREWWLNIDSKRYSPSNPMRKGKIP